MQIADGPEPGLLMHFPDDKSYPHISSKKILKHRDADGPGRAWFQAFSLFTTKFITDKIGQIAFFLLFSMCPAAVECISPLRLGVRKVSKAP